MPRILHLRSSQGLYGADHALLTLAKATGPAPIIAPLVRPGRADALGDAARAAGLEVAPLASEGRAGAATAAALFHVLAGRHVDVVHAHDYKSLWVSVLACALARIPLVATFHGDCGGSLKVEGYEAFARLLANATAACATVSAPLARRVAAWAPFTRVVHIANGIPLDAPCSAEERSAARAHYKLSAAEPVIAVVGRLAPEKGHRYLVASLKSLLKPPTVLLAGEGSEQATWDDSGLRTIQLGFQRDVRPIYAACDLVVMPSLTEGLPMVALEAMAAGRAVLASAVGELPALLSDGAGMLVPAANSAALAEALKQAFTSADERARIAERGRQRIALRYSAEAMARAYAERIYAPALQAKTAASQLARSAIPHIPLQVPSTPPRNHR